MTPRDPGEEDRSLFAVTAALLDAGRGLDALSRALTVLAFAGLVAAAVARVPVAAFGALALAALAGLAAAYAGARVAFDAALFRDLAAGGNEGLAPLDAALVRLGLVPAGRAGRPPGDRAAGATRLLRRQVLLLAVQALALLAVGAAAS